MNRKSLVKTFLISALILTVCIDGFADIRIRFARGRTSATMTGKISNGGRVCYIAGGRHGQSLTATVSSSTGRVQIFESGETSYYADYEVSGDQSICIDNLGRATGYTLTVSIK
jgi:hypothetical protein